MRRWKYLAIPVTVRTVLRDGVSQSMPSLGELQLLIDQRGQEGWELQYVQPTEGFWVLFMRRPVDASGAANGLSLAKCITHQNSVPVELGSD
jgi:hypothetical protein